MPMRLHVSAHSVPEVGLYVWMGRLQLGTADAVYSDGDKYRPALNVCNKLGNRLRTVREALVLGGGLCSMPEILARKGAKARCTVVEMDEQVLEWAMEYAANKKWQVEPICADAAKYMADNSRKYDLIFVDIFKGRRVPDFVYSSTFLQQCKDALNPGGMIAVNYIVNSDAEWAGMQRTFSELFGQYEVKEDYVNRLLTAFV